MRELGAVIDRAALLGDGKGLEVATALGTPSFRAESRLDERQPSAGAQRRAIVSLDQAMRSHIEAALAVAGGRVEGPRGAAAGLKINPHTLRARMRKLGIDWARFRSAHTEQE